MSDHSAAETGKLTCKNGVLCIHMQLYYVEALQEFDHSVASISDAMLQGS